MVKKLLCGYTYCFASRYIFTIIYFQFKNKPKVSMSDQIHFKVCLLCPLFKSNTNLLSSNNWEVLSLWTVSFFVERQVKTTKLNTSRIIARFMQNTLITLFGFSVFFIIIITIIIMVCYVISSSNPDTSKKRNNILNIVLYFMLKVRKELHKEEIPQSFQIYNPQQQFDKTNQEWIKLENFLNNF